MKYDLYHVPEDCGRDEWWSLPYTSHDTLTAAIEATEIVSLLHWDLTAEYPGEITSRWDGDEHYDDPRWRIVGAGTAREYVDILDGVERASRQWTANDRAFQDAVINACPDIPHLAARHAGVRLAAWWVTGLLTWMGTEAVLIDAYDDAGIYAGVRATTDKVVAALGAAGYHVVDNQPVTVTEWDVSGGFAAEPLLVIDGTPACCAQHAGSPIEIKFLTVFFGALLAAAKAVDRRVAAIDQWFRNVMEPVVTLEIPTRLSPRWCRRLNVVVRPLLSWVVFASSGWLVYRHGRDSWAWWLAAVAFATVVEKLACFVLVSDRAVTR